MAAFVAVFSTLRKATLDTCRHLPLKTDRSPPAFMARPRSPLVGPSAVELPVKDCRSVGPLSALDLIVAPSQGAGDSVCLGIEAMGNVWVTAKLSKAPESDPRSALIGTVTLSLNFPCYSLAASHMVPGTLVPPNSLDLL